MDHKIGYVALNFQNDNINSFSSMHDNKSVKIFIDHGFSILLEDHNKFYGDVVATCVPNFNEIGPQEHCLHVNLL